MTSRVIVEISHFYVEDCGIGALSGPMDSAMTVEVVLIVRGRYCLWA